jgi:hypothetical protein
VVDDDADVNGRIERDGSNKLVAESLAGVMVLTENVLAGFVLVVYFSNLSGGGTYGMD